VFYMNNSLDLAPYVVVENLDDVASATIKYQESDDGSTWTDIAGTPATINPGKANGQIVVTSRRLISLFAGGNVDLLVTVARQVNGSPQDLGVA
jgi:hypothetical protein